ncbi:MAG: hypothetical protein JW832_01195 [Deltaproteobacteria bacterium]|nr:hypothetical protein [Deltaproteobacteria bacterium]
MNPSDVQGLFLHASSVVAHGGALLFLGHSTAGKTTIAAMLKKKFSALADDSVFVSLDSSGTWQVVDGKFRFEDGCLNNWFDAVRRRYAKGQVMPLLGCVRIHKAGYVRTARIEPIETARCLMDAVMEIDVQRKMGGLQEMPGRERPDIVRMRRMRLQWFQQAAEIARTCPGWRLWFSRDLHFGGLVEAIAAIAAEARCESDLSR